MCRLLFLVKVLIFPFDLQNVRSVSHLLLDVVRSRSAAQAGPFGLQHPALARAASCIDVGNVVVDVRASVIHMLVRASWTLVRVVAVGGCHD